MNGSSQGYYQIKVPKALEPELRQKAASYGAVSPAELIGWIAADKISIGFHLVSDEVEALMQAVWTLRDTGQHSAALALIDLIRRSPSELTAAACEHLEAVRSLISLSVATPEIKPMLTFAHTRRYVPLREAARQLKLHKNTLRKYADQGIIPSVRNSKNQRLYDVESYLQQKATTS